MILRPESSLRGENLGEKIHEGKQTGAIQKRSDAIDYEIDEE